MVNRETRLTCQVFTQTVDGTRLMSHPVLYPTKATNKQIIRIEQGKEKQLYAMQSKEIQQ